MVNIYIYIYIYTYIQIYIYVYIYRERTNKTNTNKQLSVSCLHIYQAYILQAWWMCKHETNICLLELVLFVLSIYL